MAIFDFQVFSNLDIIKYFLIWYKEWKVISVVFSSVRAKIFHFVRAPQENALTTGRSNFLSIQLLVHTTMKILFVVNNARASSAMKLDIAYTSEDAEYYTG